MKSFIQSGMPDLVNLAMPPVLYGVEIIPPSVKTFTILLCNPMCVKSHKVHHLVNTPGSSLECSPTSMHNATVAECREHG